MRLPALLRPKREDGAIRLRFLTPDDAAAYRKLVLRLDQETPYRAYGPGERPEFLRAFNGELRSVALNPNSCIIGAEEGDDLVGYLSAFGHTAPRLAHAVSVAVAILQSHTGQGLGGRLFAVLEGWARARGIRRVGLTVATDNEPALKLYTRLGFAVEGRRRCSLKIGEEYADEFYMSKLLDPPGSVSGS